MLHFAVQLCCGVSQKFIGAATIEDKDAMLWHFTQTNVTGLTLNSLCYTNDMGAERHSSMWLCSILTDFMEHWRTSVFMFRSKRLQLLFDLIYKKKKSKKKKKKKVKLCEAQTMSSVLSDYYKAGIKDVYINPMLSNQAIMVSCWELSTLGGVW